MYHFSADWVLLKSGFAADCRVSVESSGGIVAVEPGGAVAGEDRVAGALLPGMVNLHSHAFQRAFAGRTEFSGGGGDFWSWREAMYRAASRMSPEALASVTAYLGMLLLQGGFTSLTEFHYLTHAPDGTPYANRAAMADALAAGAAEAGIGLTVLFGVYETAGFDGAPLSDGQVRFGNSAEAALGMLARAQAQRSNMLAFGLSPHSLRAVPPDSLRHLAEAAGDHVPIHIHVAEQMAEVRACQAWLLDHAPVGPHWCLVHATHTDRAELRAMAASGAVAGLCPSTEANLGDGLFDFSTFSAAGGRFGVGSDSNVAADAFGELRLLEYGQRLRAQKRNVGTGASGHTGTALWQAACAGGAAACGRAVGEIAPGFRADFVVIEPAPEVAGDGPDFWLDAAVFSDPAPVRGVMVGGHWVVEGGVHRDQAAITARYRHALPGLR